LSMESVEVESDEDVEVQFDGRRIYVQVKHRKEPLAWNDIEGALTRFGECRS
jgi:antitoxin component of MazEF toxin-antitoxin module